MSVHLGYSAQRNHLAGGVTRLQARHLRRSGAERSVGLRHHVPGAAEIVEVVYIKSAQIDLQRLEDVRNRDVLLLGFDAIDVDVQLRDVGVEGREKHQELGAGARGFDQTFGRLLRVAAA